MYFKHRFFGRQVSPPNENAETSIAEKPSGQIISHTKKNQKLDLKVQLTIIISWCGMGPGVMVLFFKQFLYFLYEVNVLVLTRMFIC